MFRRSLLDLLAFAFLALTFLPNPLWRTEAYVKQPGQVVQWGQNGWYHFSVEASAYSLHGDRFPVWSDLPANEIAVEFQKTFHAAFGQRPPTMVNLDPTKTNIVVVLLEYMGSQWISSLTDGVEELTPALNQLVQESIAFDQIFAVGTRTAYGVPASLASLPSLFNTSTIRLDTQRRLAALPKAFPQHQSAFFYGGDIKFDYMNLLVESGGFNRSWSDADFRGMKGFTEPTTWGYLDHELLHFVNQKNEESYRRQQPFVSVVLTVSNHVPFDIPQAVLNEAGVKSAAGEVPTGVAYADWALGAFMKEAKTLSHYKDTIYVFVADHGRPMPPHFSGLRQFRIPFLIHGKPIEHLYGRKSMVGSQVDVAPTLLGFFPGADFSGCCFGGDLLSTRNDTDSSKPRGFSFSRTSSEIFYLNHPHVLRWNLQSNAKDLQLHLGSGQTAPESTNPEANRIIEQMESEARIYMQAATMRVTGQDQPARTNLRDIK